MPAMAALCVTMARENVWLVFADQMIDGLQFAFCLASIQVFLLRHLDLLPVLCKPLFYNFHFIADKHCDFSKRHAFAV